MSNVERSNSLYTSRTTSYSYALEHDWLQSNQSFVTQTAIPILERWNKKQSLSNISTDASNMILLSFAFAFLNLHLGIGGTGGMIFNIWTGVAFAVVPGLIIVLLTVNDFSYGVENRDESDPVISGGMLLLFSLVVWATHKSGIVHGVWQLLFSEPLFEESDVTHNTSSGNMYSKLISGLFVISGFVIALTPVYNGLVREGVLESFGVMPDINTGIDTDFTVSGVVSSTTSVDPVMVVLVAPVALFIGGFLGLYLAVHTK